MARIRTIKPEFFTSEDIVEISPLARLLYIAVWCEADKAGRLTWRPKTLKIRYLPGDKCDVHALCSELIDRGLVRLYGDGLAFVPTFLAHQHINPRETESKLPDPDACPTRAPRVTDACPTRDPLVTDACPTRDPLVSTCANLDVHALPVGANLDVHALPVGANLDVHAQGGREGKGMYTDASIDASSASPPSTEKGSRLSADWVLPKPWGDWVMAEFPGSTAEGIRQTAARFADYWHGVAGAKSRKADWLATWRNWVRNDSAKLSAVAQTQAEKPWANAI